MQKQLLSENGIDSDVFYADFDWDNILELMQGKAVKYKPVSKFPSVRRDLALLVDQQVLFSEVEKIARQVDSSILKEINLFDVYEGKNLGEGKKSYAVSFQFLDKEKTLTDKRVEQVMEKIQKELGSQLGAQLR